MRPTGGTSKRVEAFPQAADSPATTTPAAVGGVHAVDTDTPKQEVECIQQKMSLFDATLEASESEAADLSKAKPFLPSHSTFQSEANTTAQQCDDEDQARSKTTSALAVTDPATDRKQSFDGGESAESVGSARQGGGGSQKSGLSLRVPLSTEYVAFIGETTPRGISPGMLL